jgi:uncharacterized membrane protein YbhN (UPF0104 family)
VLGLAVLGGIAWLAVPKLHLDVVRRGDIEWLWVVMALLANLVSVLAKATVWKSALDRATPESHVRYRDVVPSLFIGFLLNTVLFARVGEIGRVGVLRRRLRRRGQPADVTRLAGTLITEHFTLGISLVILLVFFFAFLSVPGWAGRLLYALVAAIVAIGLALAGLLIYTRSDRRRHELTPEAWWHAVLVRVEPLLHGIAQAQRLFRDPWRALLATLAGLVSWLAQILGIYWTLDGFNIHAGVGAAALVFFTSTLVQLFPVTPANVGVFQFAVVLPLVNTYGVDPTRALQFAIGLQLIEALLGVGLGFVFLSREGLSLAEARQLRD